MKASTFGKIILGIGAAIGTTIGGIYMKGRYDAHREIEEDEFDDLEDHAHTQFEMAKAFDSIAFDYVNAARDARNEGKSVFDSKKFRKSSKRMLTILDMFDRFSKTGELEMEDLKFLSKCNHDIIPGYEHLSYHDEDDDKEDEPAVKDNVTPLHKDEAIEKAKDQEIPDITE